MKKKSMIRLLTNKITVIGYWLLVIGATVACSDWTDHYEADSSLQETQQQTLWENIASSSNLTQFKSLLQKFYKRLYYHLSFSIFHLAERDKC